MDLKKIKVLIFISLSFIVALLLTLLPWPIWGNWFKPPWVVLVLIYWVLYMPQDVGVGIAWLLGLLLDIITDVPLGENALALVLISYFIIRFGEEIRIANFLQLTALIGFLVFIYQLLLYGVSTLVTGQHFNFVLCISRAAVSLLVWPLLAMFLFDYQRGLKLENNYK